MSDTFESRLAKGREDRRTKRQKGGRTEGRTEGRKSVPLRQHDCLILHLAQGISECETSNYRKTSDRNEDCPMRTRVMVTDRAGHFFSHSLMTATGQAF